MSFTADATNNALVIEDDRVIFDLNGHFYTTTASLGTHIGTVSGSSGGLTVTDGTLSLALDSDLAIGASSSGFLTVSTGGRVIGNPFLLVGGFGAGTLTVQNGGELLADDTHIGNGAAATSTATITGALSSLLTGQLTIGFDGPGALNITSAGRVGSTDGDIAKGVGSTGTVNVNGTNSRWDNSFGLNVGSSGDGTLNISGGSQVSSNAGFIGHLAGSTGAVDVNGTNSRWDASGALAVGEIGDGTLNISGGGRVSSRRGLIGSVPGSTGTATIDGANSTWVNADDLVVGSGAAGTMNITAGGFVLNANGNVGFDGHGIVHVDGLNSLWLNSGELSVGFHLSSTGLLQVANGGRVLANFFSIGKSGNGTLNISSGGRVDSTSSSIASVIASGPGGAGTATIDGAESTWLISANLIVGSPGAGTMNITAGGLVQNAAGLVGLDGGAGTVHVDGLNSRWLNSGNLVVGFDLSSTGLLDVANGGRVQADDVTIGQSGHGTLNISSGGRVDSQTSFLGSISGSTGSVTVAGAGSTWLNSDNLTIGSAGSGTMNITAGGLVQNADGIVGDFSMGTVHVDGLNSRWINSGILFVGKETSSNGLLDVANGGRVDSQTAIIGLFPGSTGSVTVAGAGATWAINGNLQVGGNGLVNGGVGTLRIQPGGTVDVELTTNLHQGDAVVLEGGTLNTSEIDFLQGLGTFQWTSGTLRVVHYDGNLLVPNGGVFAPGAVNVFSPSVNVVGIYTQQAGATLEIDFIPVAGIARSDAVVVSDSAVVGGTLALKLLNGAVPNAAASYIIFDALSIAGSFANVANGQRLTTGDGLGSFLVNYGSGSPFDPTQIVLSAFLPTALPGDYNQNGVVDAADYTLWRNKLGSGTSLPNDDTPGVGADDYTRWRTHFGQTAGSGADGLTSAAVPEPSILSLVVFALAHFGMRLRRVM